VDSFLQGQVGEQEILPVMIVERGAGEFRRRRRYRLASERRFAALFRFARLVGPRVGPRLPIGRCGADVHHVAIVNAIRQQAVDALIDRAFNNGSCHGLSSGLACRTGARRLR
jgi:hypothetical protein